MKNIKKGMPVYSADHQSVVGNIEEVSEHEVVVNGHRIPLSSLAGMHEGKLYLTGQAPNINQHPSEDGLHIHMAEERLSVDKRQTEMGEVQLHKRVIQEQQTVPVELRHEEVNVSEHKVAERPLRANEAESLFKDETIQVPLYGETADVNKEALVTGEVALNKTVRTEQRQISDTVRKEELIVDNDQNYQVDYKPLSASDTRDLDR